MKKVLTLLAIGGMLVAGGSMAFAADAPAATEARGNGFALHQQGLSPEEALAKKIQRIDDLVTAGKITPEQATAFKAAMTERMSNCDGTKSRDTKERLGVGFGRLEGKGMQKGMGARNGLATK